MHHHVSGANDTDDQHQQQPCHHPEQEEEDDEEKEDEERAKSGGTSQQQQYDSMQTWPKSQQSNKVRNDFLQKLYLESIIRNAKEFVSSHSISDREDSADTTASSQNNTVETREKARQLITALYTALEESHRRGKSGDGRTLYSGSRTPSRTTVIRSQINSIGCATAGAPPTEMGMIREEPHFESMIITGGIDAGSGGGRGGTAEASGSGNTTPLPFRPFVAARRSMFGDSISLLQGVAQVQSPLQLARQRLQQQQQQRRRDAEREPTCDEGDADEDAYAEAGGNGVLPANMRFGDGDLESQQQTASAVSSITEEDPAILRAVPHVVILMAAVAYLLGGVYIFRQLDPNIEDKTLELVLLFAFQLCTTIGWGDVSATNKYSQAFCILYTIFGVPIVYSAFANIGRLLTEFYCIDWLFLTGVVRQQINAIKEQYLPKIGIPDNMSKTSRMRFPIRGALNLLFLHQCIGVMIYSGLLRDFTVIESVYFSITSMATIGLGDLRPEPRNMWEAVLCIVYLSWGIIILSALMLSIGYYFQRLHYVVLKYYLHVAYHKCRSACRGGGATVKPAADGTRSRKPPNVLNNNKNANNISSNNNNNLYATYNQRQQQNDKRY